MVHISWKACCAGLALWLFFACPLFKSVSPAFATYWEDSFEGNDPEEQVRPKEGGFFLFRWIGSLFGDPKKKEIRKLEERDRGSGVNSGRRTLLIVTSGLVGLGAGLLATEAVVGDPDGADRFVGGALGFALGVGFGALIMPKDYNVDPIARAQGPAFARDWRREVNTLPPAFLSARVSVSF